jgi:hypothetical protein
MKTEQKIDFIQQNIKIRTPEGVIPFDMYNEQKELIRLIDEQRYVICKSARQIGTSATISSYLLTEALSNTISIVITVPSSKCGINTIHLIKELYYSINPNLKLSKINNKEIVFHNNSRILVKVPSPNVLCGLNIDILWFDNFAFFENSKAEELMYSVFPTVASNPNAKFIITSTPSGFDQHMFNTVYVEALKNENNFAPYYIDWNDVPGRGNEFKKQIKAQIGNYKWAVEFEMG